VVKVRYRFAIGLNRDNDEQPLKIKLILGTFRVWGNVGTTYILETNYYTSRWTYDDHTCPPPGPPIGIIGEETFDESSIRIAIPDYVGEGKTGSKTFSVSEFPRQTYEIDYINGLFKTDMMYQSNMNDTSGLVEIERGELITDKTGWKCGEDLAIETDFRQWNVFVTVGGISHSMAFAVPNEHGSYFFPWEMPSFTSEFFAFDGLFQVFFWEFSYQREATENWVPMQRWKVQRDDQLPGRINGVRVVDFGGKQVLEMSNVGGPIPYLPKDTEFFLPFPMPSLNIESIPPDSAMLKWDSEFPGIDVFRSLDLSSWSLLDEPVMSNGSSKSVTLEQGEFEFFRLGL
jgi:hypothetical protein